MINSPHAGYGHLICSSFAECVSNETRTDGILGDVGSKITDNFGGHAVQSTTHRAPVRRRSLFARTECEELECAITLNLMGPFRLTNALIGVRSVTLARPLSDGDQDLR